MTDITVLTLVDRISCFYSLSPFFLNEDRRFRFTYTANADWCLKKDKNRVIVLMRQFIKPDRVDLELLAALRNKYERVVFFHDDAGGGIPRLEVLPFVDLFYTKALFRDRSLYSRELYGKELYSNYYHEKYGVVDSDAKTRAVATDPAQLDKLRLSWNIGIGNFPRAQTRQRSGVALARLTNPKIARLLYRRDRFDPERAVSDNKGRYPVHARMGMITRPSITHQRKLILEKIEGNPNFLTGNVKQSQFNRETKDSKIVLSPFGWGELCLRDFETVRSGALLLKPDMSHLETWPNVFDAGVTYVPFSWDAEDLAEKADYYLAHEDERATIARNAATRYRADIDAVPARFTAIMEEVTR